MEKTCKRCHFTLSDTFYFCPNCGLQIKQPPLSTSIGRQLWIYALSFFLPPLGLFPAFKYLLQPTSKAKFIGLTAIVLTVVSIGITIVLFGNIMNQLTASLNTQAKQYQQLLGQ